MSDSEERLKKARGLLEAGNAEAGRIVLLELLKDDPNNATALIERVTAIDSKRTFIYTKIISDYIINKQPNSCAKVVLMRKIRFLLIVTLSQLFLAPQALAGFDEGFAAYQRGDYTTFQDYLGWLFTAGLKGV